MSLAKVSRSDLMSEDESSDGEYIMAPIEFEFVEVNKDEPEQEEAEAVPEEEADEEFDFRMFSMGGTEKISLKEEEVVEVKQERPRGYYFYESNDESKQRFERIAISGEVVIRDSEPTQSTHKLVDLAEFNRKAELMMEKEKKRKRQRPGKKARAARVARRERKVERKKLGKPEAKVGYHDKKAEKKKFVNIKKTRRGGKKHQKVEEKPKYRTE